MPAPTPLSRRAFLALSGVATAATLAPASVRAANAAATSAPAAAKAKKIPIGLELYSVRAELMRNLPDTLRKVAAMGYENVEFYAPYVDWTFPFAKGVRTLLDELGMKCLSTHNRAVSILTPANLTKVIELNQILGTRHVIASSPPANTKTLGDWQRACEQFTAVSDTLKPHGLATGYHNHATEWKVIDGTRHVMDVVAASTPQDFVLQLDVGTALEAGIDCVAWIKAHPGRIKSVHLKDWTPGKKEDGKAYRVLFGEGVAPWKEIIAAAESVGGVEYYLMEQEGSRFPEFETAQRCLDTWKKMRGA